MRYVLMQRDDVFILPEGNFQGADCRCSDNKGEDMMSHNDLSDSCHIVAAHGSTRQLGSQ